MDLAIKKIELINWLIKQDQDIVKEIDALRKSSVESDYHSRMGEEIESKLKRSEANIKDGRIYSLEDVGTHVKGKFSGR